jgi:putative methyltransferase (TIGR04325 family)
LERLDRRRSEWSYVGTEWPDDAANSWLDPSVAEVQRRHWPYLVDATSGTGPLGVSHLPGRNTRDDPADQNILMSFGYALAVAARGKDRLSMLDWGGGLGHYHLYARSLLPTLRVDYHCFDVTPMCEVGAELQPAVRFISDASDLRDLRFDFVLSSSSLHYSRDWPTVLQSLAMSTRQYLYIARLQTIAVKDSFVVKQTPRTAGYEREYLSWFINRAQLLRRAVECGLRLEREFVFDERRFVPGAPEQGRSWGFLLRRDPTFKSGIDTPVAVP